MFLDIFGLAGKMPAMNADNKIGQLQVLILIFLLAFTSSYLRSEEADGNINPSLPPDQPDSLQSETIPLDSLFYEADSLYYFAPEEKIQLTRQALIRYQDSRIRSDSIIIYLSSDKAASRGRSILQDDTQILVGQDIFFDFSDRTGLIRRGISEFEQGYYYGDEIRKVDKRTFDVDYGQFTTCSSRIPHFYIQANQLRVYQNDKIVAKPVIFFVNRFPVFALPFGSFTIKRGRQTGILVPYPGYNNVNGKYIENIAFYYAFREYADVTLAFDYYEKTGWQAGVESFYKKRYEFDGNLDARLQKKIQGPGVSSYEWYLRSRHHSDFSNRRTFDANLEFLSSKRVFDGSSDLEERLSEKITSSLAYKQPFLNSTLNISGKYVDDLKNERKDITLPYITYSLPSKPVYEFFIKDSRNIADPGWWKHLSLSYSFVAAHVGDINDPNAGLEDILYKTKRDSTGEYINQHNAGLKHYGKLSYTYVLKNWLNLSQSIAGNEAWFDRDRNEKKFVRGSDYQANSSLSFSLYGLNQLNTPYFKAVRHVLSPSVSFNYKPDFTSNERFYSFDGINLNHSARQRTLNFGLAQKLQLKLAATSSQNERKLNDFIKINSQLSYNFEKEGGKGFGNISHSLYLNPRALSWNIINFSVSPYGTIVQNTYDLKFREWDPRQWDWGISNWTFNLSSKLTLSGDAVYRDYFPEQQNNILLAQELSADTLSSAEAGLVNTLAELDLLEQEKKNWSLSFNHTFKTNKISYESDIYSSDLRMSLNAKFTRNWSVSYDNYIDVFDKELVSHSFTITRDLHCWKITFRYTRQRDYWSYQFRLFNVKLPDALQFRTSDHKRS
ncbi:MAG: LPS-assembly protein LptD [Candidatus Cloacimonetes bacterium]|nr:LPS-assembly protein LptD [Candidatus Cloacimonadota bacterium]